MSSVQDDAIFAGRCLVACSADQASAAPIATDVAATPTVDSVGHHDESGAVEGPLCALMTRHRHNDMVLRSEELAWPTYLFPLFCPAPRWKVS